MKEKVDGKDCVTNNFEKFISASTFKGILTAFEDLCQAVDLKPTNYKTFYINLKSRVNSWKAKSLWAKIDKRANRKEYKKNPCHDISVLIIGGGPCGLRTAIEAALLGCKVAVVEKRECFSRNNVLHLWPFLINDLKNLGAKKFFGRFCAGAIDHISIRQLQVMLLKVSLLLGVQIHSNVTYLALEEPPVEQAIEKIGWRVKVEPRDHPVSEFEFNVLIGADGHRNTLEGFERREFRGKLAIGITANLINRHSNQEARVEEISGVAFIFNQKFFKDLYAETSIDLENIVYYKDDTHYFVMTAKKHSLIKKGVIRKDYSDVASLLSQSNINQKKLETYASEAADFSTNRQLPHLDYAHNHYGLPDVAMFDFTSLFQAVNAARIRERNGHHLLIGLVGDSLVEPFWPTGSGCARGFLGAFDAAWMIKEWSLGKKSPLEVLAERESVYRLLAQTTPENLCKDFDLYGIDPKTRYPAVNLKVVSPSDVVRYFDTTNEKLKQQMKTMGPITSQPQFKPQSLTVVRSNKLLMWCQRVTDSYKNVCVNNLTTSFKNGLALCAIIHRYRPHLINYGVLVASDVGKNNQLAFDVAERELGIPPIMTGKDMATCKEPDKLAMVAYISQFYETFKDDVPVTKAVSDITATTSPIPPPTSISRHSLLARLSKRFKKSPKNKVRETEDKDEANKENKKIRSPLSTKKSNKKTAESKDIKLNGEANISDNVQLRNKPIKDRVDISQNRVSGLRSQLTTQFEIIAGVRREDGTPLTQQRPISKHFEPPPVVKNSDMCFFCDKRIYVMERMSVEGLFFHSSCFKCYYCGISLRVGSYNFIPNMDDSNQEGKFFCRLHVGKQFANRKRHIEDMPDNRTVATAIKVSVPAGQQMLFDNTAVTPQTPTDNLIAPLHKKYRATPERIELENMHANIKAGMVEVSEEELAQYNLGNSINMDSDDISSSEDEYDGEIEYEYEGTNSSLNRLSSMVGPVADEMESDDDFEDSYSEIEEEDEDFEDEDDEEFEDNDDEDSEDYTNDEDSEDSEDELEDDEEEEEDEEGVITKPERPIFSHQSSITDLKRQWLMSQDIPIKPWRPPSLDQLNQPEEEETHAEEPDILSETSVCCSSPSEKGDKVRWQDAMVAAIASYEDDVGGNNWHESIARVKGAMGTGEENSGEDGAAACTTTSDLDSTTNISPSMNVSSDSSLKLAKKQQMLHYPSISALSEMSFTISTPSSSIPSTPVSSVNFESMSYQEDSLGEYLKTSPKSEQEQMGLPVKQSSSTDIISIDNIQEAISRTLIPHKEALDASTASPPKSVEPQGSNKSPSSLRSILSPTSTTPPTVTKRKPISKHPSVVYCSFDESLKDVPSIDDVEDEVLEHERVGMVLTDSSLNDSKILNNNSLCSYNEPSLRAESVKMDTLRTRSSKRNTSGTTRAILDKRRDTSGSPHRSRKSRRNLPSSPDEENSSPTVTKTEKGIARQLLLDKIEGSPTTPDVCPAGSSASLDAAEGSDVFDTPRSPDFNLMKYENGIPSSESRSKEKRSRLSRMKLKKGNRKRSSLNEREVMSEKAKKDRKGRRSTQDHFLTQEEIISHEKRTRIKSEKAPIASIGYEVHGDLTMPDIVVGSTQLHRPARRLTIDPKLNADIDDLAGSSDDEYANQPVVVADTKPKKSPRRMWGKRFKLKSFKKVINRRGIKEKERRKMEEEEINEQLTRRVQREARRQHKQQQQKRLRMAQEIQRQLQEVEVKNRELEERGVEVEKALRGEEDIKGMDEHFLMQQWFQLINEKHALVRFESELMIHKRELELEDRHSMLEQDLRQRMAVDDTRKSSDDVAQEKLLLEEILEVVEQRDALVALLEEERLREQQEDKDVEGIMLRKGFNLALRENAQFSAGAASASF